MSEGYAAAHESSVLIDRSNEGRFELLDRDRLDLLQRMSTNDVLSLKSGEGCATVLTTALARIIDRLIIYHHGETALALCGEGRTATVRGWLQRHIFFQDKVKTRDVGSDLFQFGLFGAKAGLDADRLAPGAARLPLHHFSETTVQGALLLIARTFPLAGDGYTLVGPESSRAAVWDTIAGMDGVHVVDAAAYELLRVEAGVPEAGHELTEEYIPLEAGLWDAVSFKKGCYIGQEIIARMESRGKLARTLVRLRLSGLARPGAPLHSEERQVGSLTSVASLPNGDVLALGYLKMESVALALTTVTESGQPIRVEVIGAPQPEH